MVAAYGSQRPRVVVLGAEGARLRSVVQRLRARSIAASVGVNATTDGPLTAVVIAERFDTRMGYSEWPDAAQRIHDIVESVLERLATRSTLAGTSVRAAITNEFI